MNKFTPGPWEIGHDYLIQTVATDGWEIAEIRQDTGDFEANARLIAAAPDLLEALEGMVSIYAVSTGVNSMACQVEQQLTAMARAAIARAQGEAQ
jgi:hypothetical protein